MSGIDWINTPLAEFRLQHEVGEDGRTTGRMLLPHGDGKAQDLLTGLQYDVEHAYVGLLALEDFDRLEKCGEVPVIRDGGRRYEPIDALTFRDLSAVLDTLAVLEEERRREAAEERERKTAERKERERIRAKERRKLKKLGEW